MAFKTITTILADQALAKGQLDLAIGIARSLDMTLQVVALGLGFAQPAVGYAGMDIAPIRASLDGAHQAAQQLAELARQQLARENIRWEVDVEATLTMDLKHQIARCTRFSDLVVQLRPESEEGVARALNLAEAVLFDGNCPLLLVPEQGVNLGKNSQVMMAWDDSSTALRAARDALPILENAAQVRIAIVDPSKESADRSDPGGAFAQFLARHGVRCEISVFSSGDQSIPETLVGRAGEMGCDMIVMGAYGHSRLRQAIFGGTTRFMLEKATIPVLLAH